MGVLKTMPKKNETSNIPLFGKVITDTSRSGELKCQTTLKLSAYDTSQMEGFKEGDKVYKGYTYSIVTLKPNKPNPRNRVDLDPSNDELRHAISELYLFYDSIK